MKAWRFRQAFDWKYLTRQANWEGRRGEWYKFKLIVTYQYLVLSHRYLDFKALPFISILKTGIRYSAWLASNNKSTNKQKLIIRSKIYQKNLNFYILDPLPVACGCPMSYICCVASLLSVRCPWYFWYGSSIPDKSIFITIQYWF